MRLMISRANLKQAALNHSIVKYRGWKGLQKTHIPHFQIRIGPSLHSISMADVFGLAKKLAWVFPKDVTGKPE